MNKLQVNEIKEAIKTIGNYVNAAMSDKVVEAILGDVNEIASKAAENSLLAIKNAETTADFLLQHNSDLAFRIKRFIAFCKEKMIHDIKWGNYLRISKTYTSPEFKKAYQQFVEKSRGIEEDMQNAYLSASDILYKEFGFQFDDIETDLS